mgnify:FL=1
MMSIQPKTLVRMKQLNKVESIVYLLGGITMVAGAGLYAFLLIQPIACWLMLVGAILFALMQSRQRYLGTVLAIRRLRKIMSLAGWGFILAGIFMVEDAYHFLRPIFTGSLDGYSSYVSIFHHNWVILLLISAVIEMYTTHRISYELKRESSTNT